MNMNIHVWCGDDDLCLLDIVFWLQGVFVEYK